MSNRKLIQNIVEYYVAFKKNERSVYICRHGPHGILLIEFF